MSFYYNFIVVASLLVSTPSFGEEDLTNGKIPCDKVKGDAEVYGCKDEVKSSDNKSLRCYKKLKKITNFEGEGKVFNGKKAVAIEADGKFLISDDKRNYKIKKSKIKKAIQTKYGAGVGEMSEFNVELSTPEGGKVKLKIKKEGSGENFSIGKIKIDDTPDSYKKSKVSIGVPLANQMTESDEDKDFVEKVKGKLSSKVESFDNKVTAKIQQINESYNKDREALTADKDLTYPEKMKMRHNLRETKEKQINDLEKLKEDKNKHLSKAANHCSGVVDSKIFHGVNEETQDSAVDSDTSEL